MKQLRRITATDEHVRMGPLALFTLVTVLCLAVLAVLAVSTANATLALSQRRAEATTQLYLDETAAQTFLATLAERGAADETAGTNAGQPAREDAALADDPALAAAIDAATTATGGQVDVSATRDGDTVSATFDCGNNRQLDIALSLQADGSVLVDRWRMTTVVNEEPAMGDLFGSDSFDSDPFAMDPFAMP